MGNKRPWGRKKEERSKSFAKRGRVGGLGDYGPDNTGQPKPGSQIGGGAAGTLAVEEEEEKVAPSAKKPAARQLQSRKVHEVHPGSYAGDLADTLDEERLRLLRERLEKDDAPSGASASATGGSNGEGGVASDTSKKKVALLISYWGSAYQGLQINGGAKTVEAELELALYLAGTMSKDNFGNLRKVNWSRSGRTDKGVHAAAQLISLKMTYPNDCEKETIEAINRYLPEDIRAVDIKRAPKSFDARTRCSGRRYEYILPTFLLAPKEHVAAVFQEAIEWDKAQGGGDKAVGVETADDSVASHAAGSGDESQPADDEPAAEVTSAALNGQPPVDVSSPAASTTAAAEVAATAATASVGQRDARKSGAEEADGNKGGSDGDAQEEEDEEGGGETSLGLEPVELSSEAVLQRAAEKLEGYRVSAEEVEVLRETLKGFLGTKNYHNYTNHKQPTDASCKRLMTSITATEPFDNDGMEWIRLTVEGQSFMLHQIRKMVAATVDRVRGQSSKQDFTKSFFHVKMNLGIAPSEGLYLERPLYVPHNLHMKRQGAQDRALEWETGPAADALEEFKTGKIHAGILSKEKSDHDFVAWLDRLTRYPCTY